MIIDGQNFKIENILDSVISVSDSFVKKASKIGTGNGEAKLYISGKEEMYNFFGNGNNTFTVKCFLLKSDLLTYMNALYEEYLHPSQPYDSAKKMPELWKERMFKINNLPEIIDFNVSSKDQIIGPRGYVNSNDVGYQLIREISLPLITYISIMHLHDPQGSSLFYWKLFADFDAISDKREALVFNYGKKQEKQLIKPTQQKNNSKQEQISRARQGQGIYREKLLEECPFCPITMINDERLLIASHIKPWVVSSEKEKIDHKNGFMLSPLFDKLFDRGFMTFSDKQEIHLSNWLSPHNKKRLGVTEGQRIQMLPLDEERKIYLEYHRNTVFRG